MYGDINRGVSEAGEHICEPLRMFAYLLGTLDGHEASIEEAAPVAVKAIAGSTYGALFDRQQSALRDLWMRRGSWTSFADFDPLRQIVCDALSDGGVVITVRPGGEIHVGFPFLPGTVPDDDEVPRLRGGVNPAASGGP